MYVPSLHQRKTGEQEQFYICPFFAELPVLLLIGEKQPNNSFANFMNAFMMFS